MAGRFLFLIIFAIVSFTVSAQHYDEHELQSKHEHDVHEHGHTHEIGASVATVYFPKEGGFNVATHLHYVYNFSHTKFGIGAGYERVFDEHKHNFIGVELNYRPVHRLSLNLLPGVVFEGQHKDEKDFALHFETVYEFELGHFHIIPKTTTLV